LNISEGVWTLEFNVNLFLTSERNQPRKTGYLRFSITGDALERLQLTSEEFMRSLFNTTVTDALGSDLGIQQIANCYQVPKYV